MQNGILTNRFEHGVNMMPYLNDIMTLKDADKLYLINILTASMLENTNVDEDSYTKKMIAKHAGKWKGEETAEDIISAIKENRSKREPLNF